MTDIEVVTEGTHVVLPDYSNKEFSDDEIARGQHRSFVTGRDATWEHGGALQLTFLRDRGLKPDHRVVDIGCGALRAGMHLVDYLDAGNYYGIDANRHLIQIGYDQELNDEQRAKLPVRNLRANDRFNVDYGVQFDMAIAQSVFTHVSLNHIRLCLYRLAKVLRPGGTFYASFNEQPAATPLDHIFERHRGGRSYFYEKNVFWYLRQDLRWAAEIGPWAFKYIGDYGTTQKQVMASFTRLEDTATQPSAADRAAADRAKAIEAKIRGGGAAALLLRARRKTAKIISPY